MLTQASCALAVDIRVPRSHFICVIWGKKNQSNPLDYEWWSRYEKLECGG